MDEAGKAFCFACQATPGHDKEPHFPVLTKSELISDWNITPIGSRNLSADTCRRYGYGTATHNGKQVHVANWYNDLGEVVGQKVRYLDSKRFEVLGEVKGLYGKTKMRDSGKMVVVTEGELDCLAVSECLGNKWPVVSLPNGTSSAKKTLQAELEWLERFDRVVLCFDQDSSGRKAMEECRELFSPGKVRIVTLPRKDPCDMVLANERDKLVDAIWNAPTWVPGGILGGGAILRAALDRTIKSAGSWPWAEVDSVCSGLRYRELVMLCAGTGIGKSTVCRELAAHRLRGGETVGYLALEESPRTTALGIFGIHCDKPLIRQLEPDEDLIRAAFADWGDRLYLFDHFGSASPESLLSRVRYMIVSLGCRTIILDHLSILISGLELDDERRAIDSTMTKLREMVEQTGVLMIVVSHLKRPPGRGHEVGEEVALSQLRGSAAIAQLSDMVIGLERDQQDDDEHERNTLRVRVLKNRFSGRTGLAGVLEYDQSTGRLAEKGEQDSDFS